METIQVTIEIPDWTNYVALGRNGNVWFYTDKPQYCVSHLVMVAVKNKRTKFVCKSAPLKDFIKTLQEIQEHDLR